MPTRTSSQRQAAAAARRVRRAEVEDPAVVMEAAATFLAVRSRSTQETRRRLRHLGYAAGIVDGVVSRLVEMDYLDDAAFARTWVEGRDRARPRGAAALRRELSLKGIDREIVDVVLADRDEQAIRRAAETVGSDSDRADADRLAAERLLDKRAAALARVPDVRRRRQKAYALLARSGFAPDICHEVASRLVADPDDRVPEAV